METIHTHSGLVKSSLQEAEIHSIWAGAAPSWWTRHSSGRAALVRLFKGGQMIFRANVKGGTGAGKRSHVKTPREWTCPQCKSSNEKYWSTCKGCNRARTREGLR